MDLNFFKRTRILDGGMGQELLARGMKPNGTLWSANALLNEEYHKLLLDTHLDFIKAGAEVIVTTTFTTRKINYFISLLIGSFLGLISGVVGIGGGIFLSPILFLLRADKPKNIITTASLFILINSISGIFGQLTKENILGEIINYWPLFCAVLLGGLFGNFLNLKIFSNRALVILTSLLVIFVAIRMALKIFI